MSAKKKTPAMKSDKDTAVPGGKKQAKPAAGNTSPEKVPEKRNSQEKKLAGPDSTGAKEQVLEASTVQPYLSVGERRPRRILKPRKPSDASSKTDAKRSSESSSESSKSASSENLNPPMLAAKREMLDEQARLYRKQRKKKSLFK